jgi:hypothetical protein
MAITECNLHVGAPQSARGFGGAIMAKPQFYDYVRRVRENKGLLREYCKDEQIQRGHFVSEDMLIRSHKEITQSLLPYLRSLLSPLPENVAELTTFRRYGYSAGTSSLTEEEARDNFFKEQLIEEQYRQQTRKGAAYKQAAATKITFEAKSCFKQVAAQGASGGEISDSDLDILLDELVEVMNEEDISDFSDDSRHSR